MGSANALTIPEKWLRATDKQKEGRRKKTESIVSYNNFMRSVDRMDQLMSYYSPLRKTQKWYSKVVLQHLDMAMVNAFILYKKVGGTKAQLKFRKSVIALQLKSDIRKHEDFTQTSNTTAFHHHKSPDLSPCLLSTIGSYPFNNLKKMLLNSALFAIMLLNCADQNQRKKIGYMCETCPSKLTLCVVPCFKKCYGEVCV